MPDIKRAGGHVLTEDHGWVLADLVKEEPVESDDLDAYAVGGGWYEIGDEKIQGKKAARKALEALGG